MEAEVLGAGGGEFSLIALFLKADIVVKTVMVMLVLASVWSWGIIIDKLGYFGGRTKRARQIENEILPASDLRALEGVASRYENEPSGAMVRAALREIEIGRAPSGGPSPEYIAALSGRVDRTMGIVGGQQLTRAEQGLGVLASIGSAAPFIGLFGTVWGIMNSFRAIAISQDTNLAVVAPGIAEALFATALGLVAAIPAVIYYNKFASDSGRLAAHMDTTASHTLTLIARLLDQRGR